MKNKISSKLDSIADRLETKGLIKEAFEIDKISDVIDADTGITNFFKDFGSGIGSSLDEENKKRLLNNDVAYKKSILLSARKYLGFEKAVQKYGLEALKNAVSVLTNNGYFVDLEKGIIEKR